MNKGEGSGEYFDHSMVHGFIQASADFILQPWRKTGRTWLCIPAISINEGKNATLTFIMKERGTPILNVTGFR